MGADIHIYPEYVRSGSSHWSPICGQFRGDRDYALFGLIANVRGDGQMFPLRGLPDDPGYEAKSDNELYISEREGDQNATPTNAARWVAEGSSAYTGPEKKWVTHPDWHSHTWLTSSEFREVLRTHSPTGPAARYWALLAMLDELERREYRTRLVIWFDN